MKVDSAGAVQPVAGGRKDDKDERRAARRLEEQSEVDSSGDEIVLFGIPQEELTPHVRRAVSQLAEQLEGTRGELAQAKRQLAELKQLADHDTLTPTLNRRAFLRELRRSMAFAQRHGVPLSIVFVDINELKALNDRYGHSLGDEALRRIAETLLERTRESDAVGRIGGDEFALILPQTSGEAARDLAARLSEAVAAIRVEANGDSIPLSISYGVHAVDPQEDPDRAIAAADQEMYAHKRGDLDTESPIEDPAQPRLTR